MDNVMCQGLIPHKCQTFQSGYELELEERLDSWLRGNKLQAAGCSQLCSPCACLKRSMLGLVKPVQVFSFMYCKWEECICISFLILIECSLVVWRVMYAFATV